MLPPFGVIELETKKSLEVASKRGFFVSAKNSGRRTRPLRHAPGESEKRFSTVDSLVGFFEGWRKATSRNINIARLNEATTVEASEAITINNTAALPSLVRVMFWPVGNQAVPGGRNKKEETHLFFDRFALL